MSDVNLGILFAVAAPASFLTGFAAAAMSFTAWNLIVPLMFTAFGLPVFQALFLSIMLDVCNGLTLIIIYGQHGKVDFRYGLSFGTYAAGIAIILSLSLSDWILNNQDKLKSAASFVPLLIGIQFLIRGVLAWRDREKKKALEEQTVVNQPTVEEPQSLGGHGYVYINSGTDGTKDLAKLENATEIHEQQTIPPRRTKSAASLSTSESDPLVKSVNNSESDDYEQENANNISQWRFWLYLLTERFSPEEDILHRPLKYPGARIAVTLLVFTILGGVAGTLYAGGGMFYANIIVNAWGAKVRTAAGTGCFIMTMVMIMIAFTFIGREGMNDIDNLYHFLLTAPFGVLGSIVGARLALKISDMLMYFVIVGVSFTLFTYIVVQNFILNK